MSPSKQVVAVYAALSEGGTDIEVIARIREIVGEPEAKGRKIVQIETVYDYGENGRYQPHVRVFALYDDGTVKQSSPAFIGEGWQPYAATVTVDVPQDTPAESPDPIAELEAMGGFLTSLDYGESIGWTVQVGRKWDSEAASGALTRTSDLRAAAARLLARVRGEK